MINERLTFGIDLGIGSCGWAVLRHADAAGEPGVIEGLGSWCFDVPETSKERIPTNQVRRSNRLLRRVIRRRRNRMAEIRRLFLAQGLLPSADEDALKRPRLDPWELRARGLDQCLRAEEFAVALGHIAKHRGFRSSAKRKAANTSGDDGKMLSALEVTRDRLARYRTVGEMFARDPEYSARRRNRDGIFDRTVARDDLIHEVGKLFKAQRARGGAFASPDLEADFNAIAFRQAEMQDSERLVGNCPFERDEKRAARWAPSFERFRLLTRLINLRIATAEGERRLTPEDLARVSAELGMTAKLPVSRVRALIGLLPDERFTTIRVEDEDRDIVARTGEAAPGTWRLRKTLGEALWAEMQARPDQLDAIAHVLSFFEATAKIRSELDRLGLPAAVIEALDRGLEDGAFAKFKGAGHISARACRNLLPHLQQGHRYDQACRLAGYDHAASTLSHTAQVVSKAGFNALVTELGESIANPIARKALTEGLKQIRAMCARWGLPGAIHIELAREVGNSIEKRRELESQRETTTKRRQTERDEIRGLLALEDVDDDTLLRYRLWKEQGGKCLYTGKDIHVRQLIATDNSVQVDHILPWSRFGDDSFNNKTLCLASANQRKRGQTPWEWFSLTGTPEAWEVFASRVETSKDLRGFKKRNLLLKNADEVAQRFRSRNLNDTRYAARLLAEAAKLFYPAGDRQEKDGRRRVLTRPGPLTAALRHAWGLESLKKADGKRVSDDRHHALDALAVAAISEREVQRLTRSFQEWEQQGLARPLRHVAPPWPGFRGDVLAAYAQAFVARPERRRARGKGHDATIRQVVGEGPEAQVFERRELAGLKEADLDRVKDPERNQAIIEAVRAWIRAGRPADAPPRSPRGDVIVKLRMAPAKKIKPAVPVRGGTADRGDMVRIDVFTRPNRKGRDEWYLVPIYPHQVMNRKAWPHPPMHFVVPGKDETHWEKISDAHVFKFSIYPRSYVKLIKTDGDVFEGYFSGMDRSKASFRIFSHSSTANFVKGLGTKTLAEIKKFNVDRFGIRTEVKSEVRTWHGEVYTSPVPPD